MTIDIETKGSIIKRYRRGDQDTGSPEIQVAILTHRIVSLTEHLKVHKKDVSTRHGLIVMVSRRRRLLDYLRKQNTDAYHSLINSLGLRR